MSSKRKRLMAAFAVAAMIAAAHADAQIQIRGVVGSGGTFASTGTIGIVGTVGQSIIGPVSTGTLILSQGFWYIPALAAQPTGVDDRASLAGAGVSLTASRNPFATQTELRTHLVHSGRVSLKLYDALGRDVQTLIDEHREAGDHAVVLDAADLESGSYLAQLVTAETRVTLRILVVK